MKTARTAPPLSAPLVPYAHDGVVLLRVTTDPGGFDLLDLDPADPTALESDGRTTQTELSHEDGLFSPLMPTIGWRRIRG